MYTCIYHMVILVLKKALKKSLVCIERGEHALLRFMYQTCQVTPIKLIVLIIGASLSEPHAHWSNGFPRDVYIYVLYVIP